MSNNIYTVYGATRAPEFKGLWDGQAWQRAPAATLASFRPESSDHRPLTRVKLLYDRTGLYGLFRVRDRYVRCIRTGLQAEVYKDSCVEFFVKPLQTGGYFNFEFNCGGAMRAAYIRDHRRTRDGFKDYAPLPMGLCRRVRIHHTMPETVAPERVQNALWHLEFFIPLSLLETYTGKLAMGEGGLWQANFYKCADESSHPHWAAWSEVDALNFHLPHCFGQIRFAGPLA